MPDANYPATGATEAPERLWCPFERGDVNNDGILTSEEIACRLRSRWMKPPRINRMDLSVTLASTNATAKFLAAE